MNVNKIIQGDIRDVASTLPDQAVNCIVTSPPYFGLRNYNVDNQIGLEATIEDYVSTLVSVFRELRRVLRDDGTLWLNLGDSYASQGGPQIDGTKQVTGSQKGAWNGKSRNGIDDLPPKNLCGIPWRVALALQADGWILRSDIIWSKKNPMPESVTDRPTKAHEYIFLLSKKARYYYDQEAVREPNSNPNLGERQVDWRLRPNNGEWPSGTGGRMGSVTQGRNHRTVWTADTSAELLSYLADNHPEAYADVIDKLGQKSDIWKIATRPYKGAHFAVFPPDLVKPCILAGCPPNGVVLDPFFGSGTVGKVAIETGRNWLGIELNPEYVELARKRLATSQPPLFAW